MRNFYLRVLLILTFVPLGVDGQTIIQEVSKLSASDRNASDQLGFKVAISGEFAVASSPFEDHDLNNENYLENSGSVYIYKRNSQNEWIEFQKITPSDREENTLFGTSIAIDNQTIAVGKKGYNSVSGSVYIFELSEENIWTQTQKLIASDYTDLADFGFSVSIHNNKIFVGAPNEKKDENGENPLTGSGAVYFFNKTESNNWVESQKIVAQDRGYGDNFGRALSIYNNQAVVTAPFDSDGNGPYVDLSGSAYVLSLNNDQIWEQHQKITANDRNETDYFGWSCDIFQNNIIIGSVYEDHDENAENFIEDTGSAYIFNKNEDTWYQSQKLVAPNRDPLDKFGYSVAIDSNFIIIGAFSEDQDPNEQNFLNSSGSIYVYQNNEQFWNLKQKNVATDRNLADYYGYNVDVDEDYFISGAINQDEDRENENFLDNAGMAYILKNVELPNINCNNLTVYLDENGSATITAEDVDNGSFSSESEIELEIETTEFDCSDIGYNYITLTGTDIYNSSECIATINVIADTFSNITCPQDLTVYIDNNETFYEVPNYSLTEEVEYTNICNEVTSLEFNQTPEPGTHLEAGEHNISFSVTNYDGSITTCNTTLTVDNTLGINTQKKTPFKLYPNPTSNILNIESNNLSTEVSFSLYDLKGKKIKVYQKGSNFLDLSTLSAGIYLLIIESKQFREVHKIIKL
ncbi:T9SS type A sorting domain-containing protein [Mesonia sp.]|uniref:T9SS type A sorting domain-containing protein n=1 Tax=Mesonia sp. TaxID=1960830 RepID=UPI0017744CBA|nr:T9SS type A sorting domain-containing protein [Mesonia sp.]HIB36427.1 T9SS type A sorting domain-containing protein [Mesonia sp.]HIO26939.1 T9SS type A sorting domain-containing protein [Flavobacteriaceae bacterium]